MLLSSLIQFSKPTHIQLYKLSLELYHHMYQCKCVVQLSFGTSVCISTINTLQLVSRLHRNGLATYPRWNIQFLCFLFCLAASNMQEVWMYYKGCDMYSHIHNYLYMVHIQLTFKFLLPQQYCKLYCIQLLMMQ